jgi:ketosteroid isomerase-like protein
MRQRGVVAGALVVLSACNVILVDVRERHPTPRPLWPRPVATIKTYETRPPGGVAVYGLQAAGGDLEEVEGAIRAKAASLGCDGVMISVREEQSVSHGVQLTGKLIEAREYVDAHIDALCMVDPAAVPEICPTAGREPTAAPVPAALIAPVDAESAARAALERWRQAYEARSGEALAKLYAHDASLTVVEDSVRWASWATFEPVLRDRIARAAAHLRLEDVQVRAIGATAVVVATVLRERAEAATTVRETGVLTLVLRADTGDPAWVIVAEHYSRHW